MGSTSEPRVLEPPAHAESRARFRSDRASGLNESVIREMTRLAFKYNAVNLAQGYPDFPAPAILKQAAIEAIEADINQYSITWGAKPFRDAIAAKYRPHLRLEFDPEREITVVLRRHRRHDRIARRRHQSRRRSGAVRTVLRKLRSRFRALRSRPASFVTLHAPDWTFDREELRRAFSLAHQSHHSEFAQQSHRQRVHSRRAGISSRASARNSTRWRSPMKSTSIFSTMGPSTFR